MNKVEAINIFGNASALARALGLTRGRISQWSSELDQAQIDRVTGAAYRLGLHELLPAWNDNPISKDSKNSVFVQRPRV